MQSFCKNRQLEYYRNKVPLMKMIDIPQPLLCQFNYQKTNQFRRIFRTAYSINLEQNKNKALVIAN